jgi:hypothetical protein
MSSTNTAPALRSTAIAASSRWKGIWEASGALSAALFVSGLLFANVPRPSFPAPDASLARINAYFSDHRAAALGLSVSHSLSALALLAFVAYLRGVLGRIERGEQRLATLAANGGLLAAGFLLLSALLYWTLTRAEVAGESGAAHAVLYLSYLAGGQAPALAFAALIGAASLLTLRARVLPTWIGRLGLLAAALGFASVVSLLWDPTFYLLLEPAGALSFLWLFAASIAFARDARAQQRTGGA